MKKPLLALILTSVLSINAQDVRTTLGVFFDPNATRIDGFNVGVNLEYQRTVMYNKLTVFYFPNLRGKDYLELSATIMGFNHHLGYFKTHRLNVGFKCGLIIRETSGAPHPMLGAEGGYQWYLTKNLYLGVIGSYEYRVDNKVWDASAEPYWRLNGYATIGFTL